MGLKSIFDGLYVDQLIQKNERGETIVYPHGFLGRGYVLPPGEEPRYRRRVRTLLLVSLVIGISFGMLLLRVNQPTAIGWSVVAGLAALLLGAIFYAQSRLAIGLEPAPGPRLSTGQWLRRGREARPTWTYWFGVVGGLTTALGAVGLVAGGIAEGSRLVAVCSIFLAVLGILVAIDGIFGLIERARAR